MGTAAAKTTEGMVEGTRHDAMPPGGATKVLLHSCCAPCSGAMFEEMLSKGLEAGAL